MMVFHFIGFLVFPNVVENLLLRTTHPDVDVARQTMQRCIIECRHTLTFEDDTFETCIREMLVDFRTFLVHETVAFLNLSNLPQYDESYVERRTLLSRQTGDAIEQHAHHVLLL